jgi:hypothetical protein
MATITKQALIDTSTGEAWDALRDFGAVHERLVPGFVLHCRLKGDTRVVTFFNGASAREVLVGIDEEQRRLAYSVVEGPLGSTHHNASAQVFDDGPDRCRFVWTTDVLPDAVAPMVDELMSRGIEVIGRTLTAQAQTASARSQ